ncbi:MAG: ferredoxin--NADP reductase [Candidatus Bathyarchaeia archaeon]|jgi:ferredoxin-NADP reductase
MKFETTIQSIIQRTSNVMSLRFPRPEGLNYTPGQFFFVTLRGDGKEVSRHFSFSSSPTQPQYIEFTKKLSDSDFSALMRTAKVDNWARIDGPYGTFTFEGEHSKIALLGGGIGITPFISICQYATDKAIDCKITLFYACRTQSDIVFKNEFEELAAKNPNLKIHFVLSQPTPEWKGATGHINADMIKQELPDFRENMFFSCGPPPMVKAMQELVASLGLPKEQFKQEYFSGYTQP